IDGEREVAMRRGPINEGRAEYMLIPNRMLVGDLDYLDELERRALEYSEWKRKKAEQEKARVDLYVERGTRLHAISEARLTVNVDTGRIESMSLVPDGVEETIAWLESLVEARKKKETK